MFLFNGDWAHVKNLSDCTGLVAEFTYKLCKKHNLNIIFTGAPGVGDTYYNREIYFYKHFLKNYDFKIFQSPNKLKGYQSYVNIMQSKLTIALWSTILREAISLGKVDISK